MFVMKVVALALALSVVASAAVTGHQLRTMAMNAHETKIEEFHVKITNNKTGDSHGLLSTRASSNASGTWSYADLQSWPSYSPFCDGTEQSPINLETSTVGTGNFLQKAPSPGPALAPAPAPAALTTTTLVPSERVPATGVLANHLFLNGLEGRYTENHGHNIQVNGVFGSLELPNGMYDAVLLNFHFPSEHTIDGEHMSGEMQILLRQRGTVGTESMAAIAILLQEEHGTIQKVLEEHRKRELEFLSNLGFGSSLPGIDEVLPVKGPVDIGHAYKRVLDGGFYHYDGSLTFPPCTQGIHWFVMQQTALVTSEMVTSFKAIFPNPANNRPVQPLGHRQVIFDSLGPSLEYATEPNDYTLHGSAFHISPEEAEHYIKEKMSGPEIPETLPSSTGERIDSTARSVGSTIADDPHHMMPPANIDGAHDKYPSDTGASARTPDGGAPHAGAAHVSVGFAMLLSAAWLIEI